jgi:hypothetical protein
MMLKVLSFFRPTVAEILSSRYFIMPSILVALMLSVLYVSRPILLPPADRKLTESVMRYLGNLRKLLSNILHIRWLLLQTYIAAFLSLHLLFASLFHEQIEINGETYYVFFDPFLFLAQMVSFFVVALLAHFLTYFVSELLLWPSLRMFYE